MIFLNAAQTSTPLISSLVYTRKSSYISVFCTMLAASKSLLADTIAVGIDKTTSSAWVGPDSATTFLFLILFIFNSSSKISDIVYKVLSTDTIEDNGDLVVGYIAPGQTGIDGYITIMAWLDAANIAITDTSPEEVTDTNNDGYLDGTTDDWINGRTVFTTSEWNALTANGVSFQVKVEANEGTWVPRPVGTATFDTGSIINEKFGLDRVDATGFDRVYEKPDLDNLWSYYIISSPTSEELIYAWATDIYDEVLGQYRNVIEWYTDANIVYLNEDSSYLFYNFAKIDTLNGFDTVSLSNVKNMSYMFSGTTIVNYSLLANWDVSNVENMSYMFSLIRSDSNLPDQYLDASYINNWNVMNVTNFDYSFMEEVLYLNSYNKLISDFTYPTFTSRPGICDNSIVTIDNVQYYSGTYVPNN